MESDPGNVPDGYNEKSDLGRPKEKATKRNTQADNFGKDRLGAAGMKDDYNNPTRNTQPTLENAKTVYAKNKQLIESLSKDLVYTADKRKESLLDESKIKE